MPSCPCEPLRRNRSRSSRSLVSSTASMSDSFVGKWWARPAREISQTCAISSMVALLKPTRPKSAVAAAMIRSRRARPVVYPRSVVIGVPSYASAGVVRGSARSGSEEEGASGTKTYTCAGFHASVRLPDERGKDQPYRIR